MRVATKEAAMTSEPKENFQRWHKWPPWRVIQRIRPERSWRIGTKLIVFTVPLIAVVTVLAAWTMHERNALNLQEKLAHRARALHTQIMADREYYASVIVPRVIALGGSLGTDYRQRSEERRVGKECRL